MSSNHKEVSFAGLLVPWSSSGGAGAVFLGVLVLLIGKGAVERGAAQIPAVHSEQEAELVSVADLD